MEKITSKNNTIIKDTKRLFTSSKARRENQLFALEGARLCFDVLNSVYSVDTLLVSQDIIDKYPQKFDQLLDISDKVYLINNEVAQKLTDTKTPQGIFALVKMQKNNGKISCGKYIALDGVQDPSNIGAIIRSGEALGIDGIITYNSCDIFNPKAIRASMGSVLRANIIETVDLESTIKELQSNGFMVYSTVPDSSATDITTVDFDGDVVSVIGNEANGVEENIKNASSDLITIKMLGNAESLNASVAASITMWEMLR